MGIDHEAESLPVHVAACAERYKTLFNRLREIDNRLTRIEKILLGATGLVLTTLFGVIATLLYSGAPWDG